MHYIFLIRKTKPHKTENGFFYFPKTSDMISNIQSNEFTIASRFSLLSIPGYNQTTEYMAKLTEKLHSIKGGNVRKTS